MSYIELGNVMFRGEIRGAKGTIHGKLTAKAVNAADTLNFKDGQITYSVFSNYVNRTAPAKGDPLFSIVVNIPDTNGGFVEITAHAANCGGLVYIDGTERIGTSGSHSLYKINPYNELVSLAQGNHTIEIRSNNDPYDNAYTGLSSEGYILVRYIRATGSANR